MKVLQVIDTLGIGGAEVLVKNLVLGLLERGVLCEVYLLRRTGSPLELELEAAGVVLHGPTNVALYSPRQVLLLARHLREHNYQLIHVHLFPAQLWVPLAIGLAEVDVPMITTEHNTYNRRRRFYFRPIDRWMYGFYRRIVCVSQATLTTLAEWLPNTRPKLYVVQNGISFERFARAEGYRKEALIGQEAPLVVCVGRLELQKGQATAIKALTRLQGVHLALVGDGPLRGELEALARAVGVGHRVHFLGRRTDIPQILKTADVYVQPSLWEGFGIAAVEAMAAGLPIVASRVPGLADVIGEVGMFFPAGDEQSLANCLRQLLSDAAMRRDQSNRAKERARAFDIEATTDLHYKLYHDMLSLPNG